MCELDAQKMCLLDEASQKREIAIQSRNSQNV